MDDHRPGAPLPPPHGAPGFDDPRASDASHAHASTPVAAVAAPRKPGGGLGAKPAALVELGLTLPFFLVYHVGVVFLRVRNGADLVTGELLHLAEGDRPAYLALTAAIGIVFAGVFWIVGRGETIRPSKFVQMTVEGLVYAVAMRTAAGYVDARFFAGPGGVAQQGPVVGFVMSCGAGFYGEIAFRVLLFGLGAKVVGALAARPSSGLARDRERAAGGDAGAGESRFDPSAFVAVVLWAVAAAAMFSGVHYIGTYGDPFDLRSFVFRLVLGLALTLIYATRGFAAAVWSHALYDMGVLVL